MLKKGFSFLFLVLFFCSCNKESVKKDVGKTEEIVEAYEKKECVYYFSHSAIGKGDVKTKGFIRELDKVSFSKVPKVEFMPWTEAVRVSGIGFIEDEPYFIVNKKGVLLFNPFLKDSPFSYTQTNLFPACSVAGFYNTDIGYLVRSFKTSLFEYVGDYAKEQASKDDRLPVLNRYNSFTCDVEPLIFPHHFSLPPYASLTSLIYSDRWYASFKLDGGERVEFRYFAFDSVGDVLNARYDSISAESFMKTVAPIDKQNARFGHLPSGLQGLLDNMKEENVLVEYFDKTMPSPIKLLKSKIDAKSFEDAEIQAYASPCKIGEKIYYSVLLENGKLYLYSTEDDENMKVYLLPKLPQNFTYSYFTISRDTLFASWEETAFYECARAGFFISPLSKLQQPDN